MKKLSLLFLGVSALLASCGGTTPPASPVSSISGTVVELVDPQGLTNTKAWTGGAGSIEGRVASAAQSQGNAAPVIASGVLNANGSFTLSLPNTIDLSQGVSAIDYVAPGTLPGSCSGTPQVSDKGARLVGLAVQAVGNKRGSIQPLLQSLAFDNTGQVLTATARSGVLLYAERALTLKGTLNCAGTSGALSSLTFTLDMNLSKGWNKITVTSVLTQDSSKQTFSLNAVALSGTFPTDNWVFLN